MMLAVFGALVLGQLGGSSDPRRTFAAGEKDVVMMLPPETVCGSDAGEMTWSSDGNYLVVVRNAVDLSTADLPLLMGAERPTNEVMQRLRPRTELVTWSVRTRKAQTVLTTDPIRQSIIDVTPMPGSDRFVIQTVATSISSNLPSGAAQSAGEGARIQRVGLLSPATGTIMDLGGASEDQPLMIHVAENRPLAAIVRYNPGTKSSTARLFGPTGVLGTTIAIPSGSFMFDRTGRPSYITNTRQPAGKRQIQIHQLDPATGRELSVAPYVPTEDRKLPTAPLNLQVVSGRAEDANAPSIFLTVEGGKKGEAGVVTTDGTRGLMSPKGDVVAYVSQGSAMVRRLAHVDRKAYEAARMAAERAVAVSNAKQAALALIMYATDTDDNFPGQGDYNKIEPYLKNATIMNSFTYTFNGGKMTEIENVAQTEIGYVPGPGGRAVAYADGHVKWIPDNP